MTGWPLDSNKIRRGSESNTFGMVRHKSDGSPRPHQGWDFYAPRGTPAYAIDDGKVVAVTSGGDYGLVIVHSFMFEGTPHYAAYCHMKSASVKPGDSVKKGQQIGLTGDSGNANGMRGPDEHLHFEIRTNPAPGLGLAGRISPMKVYGVCPLKDAVAR